MVTRTIAGFLLLIVSLGSAADENDGELEVRKIADNVYLHTSYKKLPGYGFFPSNGLLVVHEGEAFLVDTPWPDHDTPALIRWAKEAGYTLKGSVFTHFHDDRTSGLEQLNSHGVETYATDLTNELLESKGRIAAKHTVGSDGTALFHEEIYPFFAGKGHTEDNIVIWLPETGILFGGCLIRSSSATGMGNVADASLADWATAVRKVRDRFPGVKTVVPGHGDFGGVELLDHTITLVDAAIASENLE